MKGKWLTGALVLAMAAVTLAGCGAKDETKEKVEQVTLNEVAHSIFYAPQYVAIEEGYFADEGIDLTLMTGFGADKVLTAMISGEADIGFMGAEATVYAYLEGTADPVVNFAQLTQRAGNFVVGREKDNSFTWEKLKNKEVLGGRKGGMPEMVFEYVLAQKGIDKKDVNINQSIDFGSTAAAFSGGQGDYTIEFEPSATLLEQKGDGYVVASVGTESGYVPYTSYSVKQSYLKMHGATVEKFTKALQKGMDFVQTHTPEEIAEVIAPQFAETELETITAIVRRYYALVWGNPDADEGTIEGNIGRSPKDKLQMCVFADGEQGKHAVTHWRVVRRYGYVTLVECRLETGRTHQIRVHMAWIGHPLFNDERYGGDRILKGTTFAKYRQFVENCFALLPRQALHARCLGFVHPSTGREVYFESELPADFRAVLDRWENYATHVRTDAE